MSETFRQKTLEKMLKAMKAAGVEPGGVECSPDGRIRVLCAGGMADINDGEAALADFKAEKERRLRRQAGAR